MTAKKPPSKPTNLAEYYCNITIGKQTFTKLEISPDYKEKNEEFKKGLVEKGIKLTRTELVKMLISDSLIQELVQQLDGKSKSEIKSEGNYYHYTYYTYEPVFNKWGYAFRLVWCLDNHNLHVLGIIDCYWRSKYNKNNWPWIKP